MSHTHVSNRVHCIFSTKDRRKLVPVTFKPRLWAYIDATCKKLGLKTFAVGGMEDHVHLLIALPPTMDLSTAMQKVKANSSRFTSQETRPGFAWQPGFGGFSVSISHMDATVAYIRDQEQHHRKRTFDEEWQEILRRHGIEE